MEQRTQQLQPRRARLRDTGPRFVVLASVGLQAGSAAQPSDGPSLQQFSAQVANAPQQLVSNLQEALAPLSHAISAPAGTQVRACMPPCGMGPHSWPSKLHAAWSLAFSNSVQTMLKMSIVDARQACHHPCCYHTGAAASACVSGSFVTSATATWTAMAAQSDQQRLLRSSQQHARVHDQTR